MRRVVLAALLLGASAVAAADPYGLYLGRPYVGRHFYYEPEPRIVVPTIDCSGAKGFATFRAERLFTVQEAPCQNPEAVGEPLHQVMLLSLGGAGRYDVIWVDAEGAAAIARQLEENRYAELDRR